MLSGVKLICFTASYAVALVLEITRLYFRSGIRGAVMVGFAAAGLLAHTIYLFYSVVAFYRTAGPNASPLSSKQDWYLVAAWLLAVVYLYLTYFHPKALFGVFILPLVLGLIGIAAVADTEPFPQEPASRAWGAMHGLSILLASVALLIGFAAGLMYLEQTRRLKHKVPAQKGLRLPSLEWLQRTNSRAITVAMILFGIGILSGMVLNLIRGREAGPLPWSDPVILITLLMFAWLFLSKGIGFFYRPARAGRKVAYFTVVSFLFLVIALGVMLANQTQHGGVRSGQGPAAIPGQAAAWGGAG